MTQKSIEEIFAEHEALSKYPFVDFLTQIMEGLEQIVFLGEPSVELSYDPRKLSGEIGAIRIIKVPIRTFDDPNYGIYTIIEAPAEKWLTYVASREREFENGEIPSRPVEIYYQGKHPFAGYGTNRGNDKIWLVVEERRRLPFQPKDDLTLVRHDGWKDAVFPGIPGLEVESMTPHRPKYMNFLKGLLSYIPRPKRL